MNIDLIERVRLLARIGWRRFARQPSIVRDGNHFIQVDGKWLLIDGPWYETLNSFSGRFCILIPRMNPLYLTTRFSISDEMQEARWYSTKWSNTTQSLRASYMYNHPYILEKPRTFIAYYCEEDGHLPATLDDQPLAWLMDL